MNGLKILAMLSSLCLAGCVETESGHDIQIQTTLISNNFASTATQSHLATQSRETALENFYAQAWTLPDTLKGQGVDILTQQDNLTWLLMAAGGGIALRQSGADDRIADDINRNRVFRDEWSDEMLSILGGPGAHFALTALWYVHSYNSKDDLNQQRAWTMFKALTITGATTLALKAAVNDETPNGKQWAWPSGHTSSSFTVAAVLDEFYGHQIGIPVYIGASAVAWRMMDSGDHWASDVFFGAILGHIVGHQVAGNGKAVELAGFDILPYTTAENAAVGITFAKKF